MYIGHDELYNATLPKVVRAMVIQLKAFLVLFLNIWEKFSRNLLHILNENFPRY